MKKYQLDVIGAVEYCGDQSGWASRARARTEVVGQYAKGQAPLSALGITISR
jgi:hypothetical protein